MFHHVYLIHLLKRGVYFAKDAVRYSWWIIIPYSWSYHVVPILGHTSFAWFGCHLPRTSPSPSAKKHVPLHQGWWRLVAVRGSHLPPPPPATISSDHQRPPPWSHVSLVIQFVTAFVQLFLRILRYAECRNEWRGELSSWRIAGAKDLIN